MSLEATRAVWRASSAKGSKLLLLLAIADSAGPNGRDAFPSVSYLATQTRLTDRRVRDLLHELERDGELSIEINEGRRKVLRGSGVHAPFWFLHVLGVGQPNANQSRESVTKLKRGPKKGSAPSRIRKSSARHSEIQRAATRKEDSSGEPSEDPLSRGETRRPKNEHCEDVAAEFLDWFRASYSHFVFGASYFIQQNDLDQVVALLRTFDIEQLRAMAVELLTTDDTWIAQTDRGIRMLRFKATHLSAATATKATPPVDAWQSVRDHLESILPRHEFHTWFSDSRLVSVDGDLVRVEFGEPAAIGFIARHFGSEVKEAASRAGFRDVELVARGKLHSQADPHQSDDFRTTIGLGGVRVS